MTGYSIICSSWCGQNRNESSVFRSSWCDSNPNNLSLLFYGSEDPEEYLEWEWRLEKEFRFQKLPKDQEVMQATMQFKDYAYSWWQQFYGKRFIRSWSNLKVIMRIEFVPTYYERELLHHVESITQGSNTVQDYYYELKRALRRAGVTSAIKEQVYFKGGLNYKIAAALQYKYFSSAHDLVNCAIEEEKRLMDMRTPQFHRSPYFNSYASTSVTHGKMTEHGTFPSVKKTCSAAPLLQTTLEMYHNPCKDECHIAKLSESDKNELCDSIKREVESIQIESARDTPKEKREVEDRQSEVDFETNTLMSTPSVVSHIVQVEIEDDELNIQQLASLEVKDEEITTVEDEELAVPMLHHDDLIPTTLTSTEENNKGNNIGAEINCETVSACANSYVRMKIPCSEISLLNLHNVELTTHKEVLTRISPSDSLYYIMFDDPRELSSVIENVAEISCLKSLVSSYAYTYKFNLIGDYGTFA